MKKDFERFLSQLTQTNATLDYFVDFPKVRERTGKIMAKLHQLNFLLGKDNLQEAIDIVFAENPKAFEALGILLSVRDSERTLVLNSDWQAVPLASYFTDTKQILIFLQASGLAQILRNKEIGSLPDYIFGVEAGLSSHGRKNRSGENMVKAIARLFDRAGISFQQEIHSNQFPQIASLGEDIKKFDFVIKTCRKTYLMEVNYYNSSGSKPNEVARAYSDIAAKINQYKAYEFVWITDGQGWLSSKKQLQEAYRQIPRVYNLASLSEFIQDIQSGKA